MTMAGLSVVSAGFSRSVRAQKKSTSKPATRPNILWIVAEDLSPYLPAFGDHTIETPHLSRLAAEGICYDNFFTPAAVCAPARAAIATSMYPTRIAANHMRTGPWYFTQPTEKQITEYNKTLPEGIHVYEAIPPAGTKMMSEVLRGAGYFCTNNSKCDYQFRTAPTAWDQNGTQAHWRNRESNQPFFAIFNLTVTHESQIWSRANKPLLVDEKLDVPVPPYLPDNEVGRKDIRRMYSNILEMDQQVGKLLKELEDEGLLEETVIFWYGDHGGPLPRQKRLMYDSGMKAPLIIRFPNKDQADTRNDDLLSFLDLGPTVHSLAGIAPSKAIDGRAFLGPYGEKKKQQYVHGAADRFDAQPSDSIRAVRDKRYKYIRYYRQDIPMYMPVAYREQMPIMQELLRLRDAGELTPAQALWFRERKPAEELFDTQSDPHEVNNRVDDPALAKKLQELRKECDRWIKETGDLNLMPEKELLAKLWPGDKQPETMAPGIKTSKSGKVSLTSKTAGASLGYKIINGTSKPKSWTVYTGPFAAQKGDTIKAVAHRIGYKTGLSRKKV
jgi:arylsulfatase A-like enzyme